MANDYDWNNDAWRDQVRENSARHCFVFKTFTSEDSGELIFEEPVEFGLWFSEEPIVSYGFALDMDANPDQVLIPSDFPNCTGGVIEWRRNIRGLYIGATCFSVIQGSTTVYTSFAYSLKHHFTFSGIGVKNVGSDDMGESDV